jgi:hypothetical protein
MCQKVFSAAAKLPMSPVLCWPLSFGQIRAAFEYTYIFEHATERRLEMPFVLLTSE